MATYLKNLSNYNPDTVPPAEEFNFGIVVSEWNSEVTFALLEGAVSSLIKHGAKEENIVIKHVPGSYELPLGAQFVAEYTKVDAVICLGCVIQGETPHFTYICQGVTQGITRLNNRYNLPFIFGVLTTDDQKQALDRAGGKLGNKGDESAITAIKMAALKKEMRS